MEMSPPQQPTGNARLPRVMVATTAMLSFISFWRVAAIVLNDLASSAFYAGGIVEVAVGKAAPWFILAIMLFSYAVLLVYVESCSMFVRGGVYRVVKEAMGSTLAKFSVSALMFDYILTGPISGVSAGLYLAGLINELLGAGHAGFTVPMNATAAGGLRSSLGSGTRAAPRRRRSSARCRSPRHLRCRSRTARASRRRRER